jgi:hypothetical protein
MYQTSLHLRFSHPKQNYMGSDTIGVARTKRCDGRRNVELVHHVPIFEPSDSW